MVTTRLASPIAAIGSLTHVSYLCSDIRYFRFAIKFYSLKLAKKSHIAKGASTRNEVVLLANRIESTCSVYSGNTHDGND